MKKIILAVYLLGLSINCLAEPGPPIPKPEISLSEASRIALEYFRKNEPETEYLKNEDYFIISAEYKYFGDINKRTEGWVVDGSNNEKYLMKSKENWAWQITIAHPISTDITITYKITQNKKVIELWRTE